jgi:hypothetical protein
MSVSATPIPAASNEGYRWLEDVTKSIKTDRRPARPLPRLPVGHPEETEARIEALRLSPRDTIVILVSGRRLEGGGRVSGLALGPASAVWGIIGISMLIRVKQFLA